MVIEVNKDIDRYQESVAMGLTARQLIFSIASVVVGGGIVLLLYKYIGLTGSAYVAIPCVAPIALGGFYSFNGMNFYEYMGKKLHFMFGNRALTYVSTEGEPAIKQLEAEQNEQVKKKGRKAEPETVTADSAVKKQEEFEAMKKKTRNMLLGLVAVIVAAVAGIAAYKAMHELTFKQSIAKSKECYVILRVVRKIAKKKDKCEKQAIDNEFAIELDKDELKLFKGLFAEMFK